MEGGEPDAGEQLFKATEKIAETLSTYFRNIDGEWFDIMISESVKAFKNKSMSEIKDLLESMEVSKRAKVIYEANQNLRVKHPWRPSGDPEKDTDAHIYEMDKENHQFLSTETQLRYRSLRTKLSEIEASRRTALKSLEKLEEIAKSFEDV